MKRRCRKALCLFSLLLLLAGCRGRETQEEAGYKLYYVGAGGTRLQESVYLPKAQTFEEIMDELAGQLAKAPAELRTPLKDGVEIQGYSRGIDALRIDFNREYYLLSNVDEVLLRAAVVKTFSQVPGVMKVMITVDGEQLVDGEGKAVPAMDAEDFIDTKEGGINSYQNAVLSLYFIDRESGKLDREMRSLHYSSNMVLENVVVEQLIKGPEDSRLQPVLLDSVKILGMQIQDGVCTVDLDGTANQVPADGASDAETALYAIVNSICDTCDDITGVRIRIDGSGETLFRDRISLDHVFSMNVDETEPFTGEQDADAAFGEDAAEMATEG